MRQLPAYPEATAEEDSTSENVGQPAPRRRKQMKSGMATTVTNKVTWPHEVVYTSAWKQAFYMDISLPQFVQIYMIVMEGEAVAIKRGWHHISRS